jgi:hypothetical protein
VGLAEAWNRALHTDTTNHQSTLGALYVIQCYSLGALERTLESSHVTQCYSLGILQSSLVKLCNTVLLTGYSGELIDQVNIKDSSSVNEVTPR